MCFRVTLLCRSYLLLKCSYALPPTNSRSSASISSSLDYTQHAIPLYQQTIGAGQNRTVFYDEHAGAGSQPLINFFFNNGCINLGVKIALDLKAVRDWRWALNDSECTRYFRLYRGSCFIQSNVARWLLFPPARLFYFHCKVLFHGCSYLYEVCFDAIEMTD